ncbi:PIN-like domain-containing protein [Photobacterium angustum]|uniref:PIN like domain-containing protein n=1 Tax=Photobacterium angustum TaxID=661 RepID=A0A2S7VI07_PHOAN|nr:PIN-like domain-containing protein [Photobacterium angustum]PQJ61813.1 hypothetical protein BTO08_16215 [Photobacterium angustum]
MKSNFKSFYKPQSEELTDLWNNAIFVFDTNILTNLYRYQSKTTEDFLKVLSQIQDRIWIPHHVALEYQRNRLGVIEEQHNKFAETKSTINNMVDELQKKLDNLQLKTRHSYIDPDPLINGIENVKDEFFKKLDELEKNSIQISSQDKIREKLDNLFESKVGKAPTQNEIDEQEKDGENRFSLKIPPGYEDQKKDGSFLFNGVRYQNKFGDLLIWNQIIEHSNASDIKHLIFVTDDTKKDWWEIVKGKKIGLRNELIDEIYNKSKVELVNVYQAHTFLKYASEHLKTKTSVNSIKDVELVSEFKIGHELSNQPRKNRELFKNITLPEDYKIFISKLLSGKEISKSHKDYLVSLDDINPSDSYKRNILEFLDNNEQPENNNVNLISIDDNEFSEVYKRNLLKSIIANDRKLSEIYKSNLDLLSDSELSEIIRNKVKDSFNK